MQNITEDRYIKNLIEVGNLPNTHLPLNLTIGIGVGRLGVKSHADSDKCTNNTVRYVSTAQVGR